MINRLFLICTAIVVFAVVPSLAGPSKGCNKINFYGSYTAPDLNRDVFGDGTSVHSLAFQLTINSDGTASQFWTGLPDYLLNAGTGSAQIGSWTCRSDGKLVVVLIQATFIPAYTPAEGGTNPNVVRPDVELYKHFRTTYLFSVDDVNTLTKIQSRTRSYIPNEDPTNPAMGALNPPNLTPVTYNRLIATDADLVP
jgi:hypothetical protein